MLSSLFINFSLFVALFLRVIWAQCTVYDDCDHYIVPENPPDGVDCIIDPNDSASIEVEFAACPCSTASAFGTVIYFSNDGSQGTATAITPSQLVATSDQFPTLSFDVPYSALGAEGAPVTVIAGYVEDGTTVSGEWHYTMFAESTIVYSATTTSITTPVYTTTTTTATDTEVDITVFPGPTITSKCTTGTNTVTTKPSTTTTTITSTPATKTVSKTVLSTATTTLTCVPGDVTTVMRNRRRGAFATANANKLMPRQAGGTYEFPQCIQTPISTTTIYTSTVVSAFSTTSTITAIAYTTTTSYTSSTMSAQTVCNKASSTVVITPTTTKTVTTHLSTPVTTQSFTVGVTKTVVPKNLPACTTIS